MNDDENRPTGGPAGAPLPFQTGLPNRILVVDDEPCIRIIITTVLAGSGYQVDAAEDGAAGWEALQAKHYDLLITNHVMPKITGLELVKNLRFARMDLPVVMVSGELPADELNLNPSLQPAATLLKPFTLAALLDTVKNVLRVASSQSCRS